MVVDKKEERKSESSGQVVNQSEVCAENGKRIDYDKLDQSLTERVQRLTSRKPHVFLRRGIFFAHRLDRKFS